MPQSFVQITPELHQALSDGLVLTPNERLRRHLERAFDAAQQRQGLEVWPSARLASFEGWLRGLHGAALLDDPSLPELLSEEQTYLLFRELAPEGQAHLARLAMEAWEILGQWCVPLQAESLGATENGRLLRPWLLRVRERLRLDNAVTAVELTQLDLAAHVAEAHVCCYGFENPTTRVRDWLAALGERGVLVTHPAPLAPARGRCQRLSFETPEQELAAVAQWCRQLLLGHADARIGVVVPDLSRRYQAVLRQFQAEFDPGNLLGLRAAFDVAGGQPLTAQPVWLDAERWLELCYARLPAADARRLLESKYLELPAIEPWPDMLPEVVDLGELAAASGSPSLGRLAQGLEQHARLLPEWLTAFGRALARAGWNAGAAGSGQYQAYEQINGALAGLARAGAGRTIDAATALTELRGALELRTFAPQRAFAPVQVLGYLETTGLEFTHLWVSGMDEEAWPAPVRANPFLPLALRRQFGIARSTPDEELTFARERISHWQHAAGEVLFSYARHAGEAPLEPSPLLRELSETRLAELRPERPHPFFFAQPQLESQIDEVGSPRPAGAARGGTGLLRDQASCPFRGWAIHRLGLSEERLPHAFPDPLDRGTLFHDVLQRLYEPKVGRTVDAATLQFPTEALREAVAQSLARHYRRFPRPFVEREARRLLRVVEAWLDLERQRAPFRLLEVEQSFEVALGDLVLRVRVDRLDEVDGHKLVIDYKTGQVRLPPADGRLEDPQLPIYALCSTGTGGVAFARLHEERPALLGIATAALGFGERMALPPGGDWLALTARWRVELLKLADEVQQGYAAVTPRQADSCRRCHLSDVCRISLAAEGDE